MGENRGKDRFGYDQPDHNKAVDALKPVGSKIAKLLGKGK